MTEQEWRECNDPHLMLKSLTPKADARRLRLFGVACCRRIEHLLADECMWRAVEMAEQFADGAIPNDEAKLVVQGAEARLAEVGREINSTTATGVVVVRLAALAALDVCRRDAVEVSFTVGPRTARAEAFAASLTLEKTSTDTTEVFASTRELALTRQSDFLRDIFGNPFRPVNLDPSWRTCTATALGQGIYDDRAFDRMPILGDALEEAGCTNAEMLAHCRGPGPHVRGCWAVDLILGKK